MIGVDEVGRGAWAGPLLVVALRLKAGKKLPTGLADSKVLSKQKRLKFLPLLIECCNVGEGWVSAAEIDKHGLSGAMRLACAAAVENLEAAPSEQVLLDGNINYLKDSIFKSVQTIVDGDAFVPIISAASIVAKQLRDEYMANAAQQFSGYGFASNVGYGTKQHINALSQQGVCKLHRLSYKPVRAFV